MLAQAARTVGHWLLGAELMTSVRKGIDRLGPCLDTDQITSGNKAAADACIYAALLVLAIGRKLHRALPQ